jgi:hypothetical protein
MYLSSVCELRREISGDTLTHRNQRARVAKASIMEIVISKSRRAALTGKNDESRTFFTILAGTFNRTNSISGECITALVRDIEDLRAKSLGSALALSPASKLFQEPTNAAKEIS